MTEKLKCVMLIDDSSDDNFIHEREIKKANVADTIIIHNGGSDALEYLRSKQLPHADLIFLDINMPRMNGWEFLEEYNLLDKTLQGTAIIIMLTTSNHPEDLKKAKFWSFVSDYRTKPLTSEAMNDIITKYFHN
jgi:CheY-like chemotaxis protein